MNWPTSKPCSSCAPLMLLACALALHPALAQLSYGADGGADAGVGADLSVVAAPASPIGSALQPVQLRQPMSVATQWAASGGQAVQRESCRRRRDAPPCDSPRCHAERCCPLWPSDWCSSCWADRARHALDGFRDAGPKPRHQGKGCPLAGTSWLNRPYYAGWFIGPMFGDDPVAGGTEHGNDAFGGLLLGWDYDHYWGTQLRFGWASLGLIDDHSRHRHRDDLFVADLSLLYYPWGDSRWRPYLLLGLGGANFDFVDHRQHTHDATLLALPFGGGVKYQFRRWMAMRAEILDNLAFGSEGLHTMHNVSLALGVEVHWGAKPKSYWPWRPGRHVW